MIEKMKAYMRSKLGGIYSNGLKIELVLPIFYGVRNCKCNAHETNKPVIPDPKHVPVMPDTGLKFVILIPSITVVPNTR